MSRALDAAIEALCCNADAGKNTEARELSAAIREARQPRRRGRPVASAPDLDQLLDRLVELALKHGHVDTRELAQQVRRGRTPRTSAKPPALLIDATNSMLGFIVIDQLHTKSHTGNWIDNGPDEDPTPVMTTGYEKVAGLKPIAVAVAQHFGVSEPTVRELTEEAVARIDPDRVERLNASRRLSSDEPMQRVISGADLLAQVKRENK